MRHSNRFTTEIRRFWRVAPMTLFAIVVCFTLSNTSAADEPTSSPVYLISDGSVVPEAISTIERNNAGLSLTMRTYGIQTGTAVTVWWVVFNYPDKCKYPNPGVSLCTGADLFGTPEVEASLLFGTGHVIGGDEEANFGAHLNAGDKTYALIGPGLLNPLGAEIHPTIRSHGEALPGLIHEQIHTFNGGCPPNTCTNLQFTVHQ